MDKPTSRRPKAAHVGRRTTSDPGQRARLALLSVIEDQKQAEEHLRQSEQRFRTMFEVAPLGIALMDTAEGHYLDVNPMFATIAGWTRDELLTKRWQDITHPDDLQADSEQAAKFSSGEIPGYRMKKRYVRKNGAFVWINMTIAPFVLPGNDRPRHLCMIEDITEREQMALAFAAEEARFRALSEQSVVGIYTLEENRISYMNPQAAAMFGYSADEVTGMSPARLMTKAERTRMAESARQRLSGEIDSLRTELIGLRKDGSEFILMVDSRVVEIDGRRQIMGVLQDITDRKRAEQDIRDYVTRIENMINDTVDAISFMVELRDPYTSGHERRVGELSAAIAEEMGLDGNVQHGLRLAGAVHDVGKLAVPAEILSKPGRLTPLEYEIIKGHAAQGYEVLKGIDSPWPIAEVARQHHERIDGSGYPRGLKGDEIILEARIMAVADVVESMSSHRPYRPSLGPEAALMEIERGRGTHYDAQVVDACLRLLRDKGYKLVDGG